MSLLLAPLAAAAAEPAAEPAVANEIEVIGRRLHDWRGRWRLVGEEVTCRTMRSTGDAAIDAVGCAALTACIAPLVPELAALEASGLPRKEASRRLDALLRDKRVYDCVFAQRETGIAALAAERRSKRS